MSIRGAGGGAFGAFIASVCCLLPLLLVFAGVGVAAGLVVSQYRPFFLLLGTLFVGLYIVLNLYVKVQGSCSFGEVIKKERRFVLTTIATFLFLLALVNLLVVPALGSMLAGEPEEPEAYPLKGVDLKISGMSCPSCADVLEEVLTGKAGVARAEVSYGEGSARVVFDPVQITVDEIIETLKPYRAEVISEWEVSS
jgi:copper chaperone CopZ